AALARRFAAAGARLVLADLDGPGVTAVAESVGALAVPGDAACADGVVHLVAAARAHLGEIDLYCANAGVGGAPTLQDEAGWDLSWQVNVMAHVRAARELL